MFNRITFIPGMMGGKACIRGMRIPVSVVIRMIASGATIAEVLTDYPDLEKDDVVEALQYAAWLADEAVHSA